MRLLLPLLDGAQDRSALRDRLVDALRNRELAIEQLSDGALADPDRLEAAATAMLDHMLRYLEQNALLDPN
jgi:hypothetical protein